MIIHTLKHFEFYMEKADMAGKNYLVVDSSYVDCNFFHTLSKAGYNVTYMGEQAIVSWQSDNE